jgi:hypothetical protein
MSHPVSIHQLRMLRAIANGAPWDSLHGKTRDALLNRGFVYRTDNGHKVWLSETGRALVKPLLRDREPGPFAEHSTPLEATMLAPQPTLEALPQAAPDTCVIVCCDEFEAAMHAGVVQRSSVGIAYLGTSKHRWAIRYCPWCGDMREVSDGGDL